MVKEELKYFKDFYKDIPENVHEVHVTDRFGNTLMISTIEDTLKEFKDHRVFNFFDHEDGTFDVYVDR